MYSLDDATENRSGGNNYQRPGIYDNILIEEVKLEFSSRKGSPFIRLITKGVNGEKGSSAKMYLSNDKEKAKSEGKSTTGWGVTANVLRNLYCAINNVDWEASKGWINNSVDSDEKLRDHIANTFIGTSKVFRAKFKGEETAKKNIFAVMAQTESMRVPLDQSKLSFSEVYDIKPYNGVISNTHSEEQEIDLS